MCGMIGVSEDLPAEPRTPKGGVAVKLNYITIMVRDMDKTIAFYRELAGLKILRRFNPGVGDIAFLADADGDTALECIQNAEAEKVSARGLTLSFQARGALDELRQKAVSMGYSPSGIINQPPKPLFFTLSDPDGIRVEFGK